MFLSKAFLDLEMPTGVVCGPSAKTVHSRTAQLSTWTIPDGDRLLGFLSLYWVPRLQGDRLSPFFSQSLIMQVLLPPNPLSLVAEWACVWRFKGRDSKEDEDLTC